MRERAAGTAQAGAPDQSLALAFMVLNRLHETRGGKKIPENEEEKQRHKGEGAGSAAIP